MASTFHPSLLSLFYIAAVAVICLLVHSVSSSDHDAATDKNRHQHFTSSFIRRGEAAVGHDKLECGMRLAAFKFAPDLPRLDPQTLYDALEIGPRCATTSSSYQYVVPTT